MKENSPICARLTETSSAVEGIAEQADDGEGRKRLAEQDDGKRGEHGERTR